MALHFLPVEWNANQEYFLALADGCRLQLAPMPMIHQLLPQTLCIHLPHKLGFNQFVRVELLPHQFLLRGEFHAVALVCVDHIVKQRRPAVFPTHIGYVCLNSPQSLGLQRHKPGHRLVGLGDDDFPLAVAHSTWPVFALGHEPFRLCRE